VRPSHWLAIKPAVTNQLKELGYIRVSQQIRTPLDISGVMFEAVRGWVSHQALRKVQEQRQLLLAPFKAPCSQSFTSSHGLPCAHTLKKLEEENKGLLIEHFHPHWHLKRDAARPQPMLEPRQVPKQAIQISSQPATSTRREPSGFEIVGTVIKAPAKCGACHQVGHNMRARVCPLRYSELLPTSSSARNATSNASADLIMDATLPAAQLQAPPAAPTDVPAPIPSLHPIAPETAKHGSMPCLPPETPRTPRYYSPEAIYARYVTTRSAWYAGQPAGYAQTDQEYRKAMGLPRSYSKASFEWCLDYKYMGKVCRTGGTI